MSLGTLVVELTANVAKFQSDLGRAEQMAQNTAKRIDEQFGVVKNALANFGVGLASAYTFDAISKKIEGVISSAAGLQQLSERTGATVESLSGLSSVAKLSGTDSEALATGLQKLSRTMVDAQQGGTKTSGAFAALGISAKNLASQRPEDVFVQIATQMSKYQDGAGKTAIAMELLGKSGANLLPVMKDLVEVGGYQVKVTSAQAAMADEYEKNMIRLHASTDAIFKKIGLELIPVFNAFAKAMLESQNANNGLKSAVNELAADGSIRSWAEGAAIGMAYFIDVLSVVPDVFLIVGKTIGAAAAQFMGLAQTIQGVSQVMSGDFRRGVQTAQEGLAKISGVGNEWWKDMQEIWNKPLFSDRLKKQLEEARKGADGAPRPSLPNLNLGGDSEALKKQLERQLKGLDRQIQDEQRLFQSREQFLARFYSDDLISISDYFDGRKNALDENLKNTLAAYDQEVAALQSYMAKVTDAKAKLEAQNRIADIGDRARQATSEAQNKSLLLTLDQAKATKGYADEVERLNIRLLEMQGHLGESSKRQIALSGRQARQRFTVEGDTSALGTLDKVEGLQRAQGEMNELNLKASQIEQKLAITEGTLSAQRQRGTITELENLASVSVARHNSADDLAKIAAQMMAVAEASGDPRLLLNAQAFQVKVEGMTASADVLGLKFKNIFEDGLANFLTDVIGRTKSFKDAFLDMAKGIEQAITRIVAQNLAQSLFGTSGMFGSSGGLGGLGSSIGGFVSGLFGGGSAAGAASTAASLGTGLKVPASFLNLPGLASGGDAYSNQAYLVGENGPEIFSPKNSGTVIPNNQLSGLGGNRPIVINNHFSAGTDLRTIDQAATQVGLRVQRALSRST